MAKIKEVTKILRDGQLVVLASPVPGDGESILDVVKVIIERSQYLLSTSAEFTVAIEQEERMIQEYLDHPSKMMIIPKIDGKIVGMMNFKCGHRIRVSHQGEFGMSVHPDYQGRGIGRLMLTELVNWAQENQTIETVRLRVHSKNENAIALYKSFGFCEEGREAKGIKFGPGMYDDVIIMALDVNENK